MIVSRPSHNKRKFAGGLICSLAFALILVPFSIASAQKQNNCEKELVDAEKLYRTGYFEEAISLMSACLNRPGISEKDKTEAYKLLGKAYIAQDLLEQARTSLRRMLELDPDIVLDRSKEPPDLISLFEEVRKERETTRPSPAPPSRGGSKKWLLVGGGGAAAIAVAALLFAGGGGNGNGDGDGVQPLPAPPALP